MPGELPGPGGEVGGPRDFAAERAQALQELENEQRGGRHDTDPVWQRDRRIVRERQARGLSADEDPRVTSTEAPRRAAEQAAQHERWLNEFLIWSAQGDGETDEIRMRRVSERLRTMTPEHRSDVAAATTDRRVAYWATPEQAALKAEGSLGLPLPPASVRRPGFSSQTTTTNETAG